MKFFHLSDLHIGLKLYNRDLCDDQRFVLSQVCDLAKREQPDAVVLAGDIYDRALPAADAVSVFDGFITRLTAAVPQAEILIISGNHDSAPRLNLYRQILGRQHLHVIGLPPQKPEDHIEKVVLEDAYGPVAFYLLPFVKPSVVRAIVGTREDGSSLSYNEALHRLIGREALDLSQRNVLVSHQFYLPAGADPDAVERMDSEVRTVGNIDEVGADVLEPFDYAALGHIHKPMQVGREVCRYCGTPLPCSVSEAGQQKGVVMVELGPKGSVSTSVLPLTPLHQIRVLRGSLEEVLASPSEDYVTVVLTDQVDLDVLDMQDRLRCAFPNLLEIRREALRSADYTPVDPESEEMDVFSLCSSFLRDLTPEEDALLRDVINTVQEVQP